jgi:hypothetical protein
VHTPALPDESRVFQFHGDTFDLPPEGTLLATGSVVPHQALAVGSAVGFQFHVEMTAPLIRDWIANLSPDHQRRILEDTGRFLPESHRLCRRIAGLFLGASTGDARSWLC